MDPHPALPLPSVGYAVQSPIRPTRMPSTLHCGDASRGEENIISLWIFKFRQDLKLPLPQLCFSIGGGLGGGRMHKRTTPKIFGRAKQLHRNMSPAEAKLWKHLRTHRMGNVHFRNQHAIGNYIVDFPWHRPPGQVCVPLVCPFVYLT